MAAVTPLFEIEDTVSVKKLNASKKSVKNVSINFKPVARLISYQKVKENCYEIRMNPQAENRNKIIAILKSFNDCEIEYSDDLEGNDLIVQSKKPIWVLSPTDKGVFKLTLRG